MRESLRKNTLSLVSAHLSVLRPYLDDETVTEIMVNNPRAIWVERKGTMEQVAGVIDEQVLGTVIGMLAKANGRADAEKVQILDAQMPGLRIAAARGSVAIQGTCLSIRKHGALSRSLSDYVADGLFDSVVQVPASLHNRPAPELVQAGRGGLLEFLRWMVHSRANFAVTGATSAGKTSFLNAILAEVKLIHPGRRLFTIEDTQELQVPVSNYVSFLAQKDNHETNSRALGRLALRMRPDSILHGEVRGSEAFDLLDAYRTGHPGSGVSFHAENAQLAPYRLETMVRMAPEGARMSDVELRRQISQTFQFFIHCERVGGLRMPVEIYEVLGADETGYQFKPVFIKKKEYAL